MGSDAIDHVEQSIDAYVARCRERVPAFVERHFNVEQTWRTQQRTLVHDVLIAPINSLWAVIYLAIRKGCSGLDSLGVGQAKAWLRLLPPGIPSGYEAAIERSIATDLLEWSVDPAALAVLPAGLQRDLQQHPSLAAAGLLQAPDVVTRLREELKTFSAGRAVVTSAISSGLTVVLAWALVGSFSLPLTVVAERLARDNAKRRAASRFFLGRRVGGVFYSVFHPSASFGETLAIFIALTALLAAATLVCTTLADPLRSHLGLQHRRLNVLIDSLERELVLFTRKTLKPALGQASQGETL